VGSTPRRGRCLGLPAAALLVALGIALASGCGGDSGGGSKGPTPLEQHLYLAPTAVATALAFDRVGVGYGVSCMLTASGDAWCWGDNEHGQLGAASSTRCSGGSMPCSGQPLHAAPTLRFAEISPGQIHSCGLDAAGQAWCWGFGIGGQLGDGRSMDSAVPVAVAGGHRFVQVDAGRSSLDSCALDDAGVAWCWGPAGGGVLGNGTTAMSNVPVQVLASTPFVFVGAGDSHACALDGAGQAWCWGQNAYGKLGRGVPGASLVPAPVAGSLVFSALAVGGQFNCGLTAAGAAWCWGFVSGIGDGVDQHRDVPTAVAGGHVFTAITAGYDHACGLTADGSAWCWGAAVVVGGGTLTESRVPVAVTGGQRFRVLRAGGVATCGLTLSGVPMCWGSNSLGSVGQANTG